MRFYRNIKLSAKVLLQQKGRTVLAVLGVSIGISAVIIMVSIGYGAELKIIEQIKKEGTNTLVINAGKKSTIAGRKNQTKQITTLKPRDREQLEEDITTLIRTAPVQFMTKKVKYENLYTSAFIMGSTTEYFPIRNYQLSEGRFFTEEENKAAMRVAVIGHAFKKVLFKEQDPIGEYIKIGGVHFQVIGILKSKGVSASGANEDDKIIIPLNTALRRVFNVTYIQTIYAQVQNIKDLEKTETLIRTQMRSYHRLDKLNKSDDFTIINKAKALRIQKETAKSFTFLIVGVAAISLLVGGAGILAIMLLSVNERYGEIGLRIATGATPKDITIQFLGESIILSLLGGGIGIISGVIISYMLKFFTSWTPVISEQSIIISLIFTIATGLIFGVYPARKAAQLDPIEALMAN